MVDGDPRDGMETDGYCSDAHALSTWNVPEEVQRVSTNTGVGMQALYRQLKEATLTVSMSSIAPADRRDGIARW